MHWKAPPYDSVPNGHTFISTPPPRQKNPTTHSEHTSSLGFRYMPGEQKVQLEDPDADTLPEGHGMQVAAPSSEYIEAGHSLHTFRSRIG